MTYSPKTWVTGDTITATALNNIEQGIANAGTGGGGTSALVVTVSSSTMDKTFTEIFNALNAGTPVYLKETGTITDYVAKGSMFPVICAFKYADYYRVVVEYYNEMTVTNGNTQYPYVFAPTIWTFQASDASSYPTSYRKIYPSSVSNSG